MAGTAIDPFEFFKVQCSDERLNSCPEARQGKNRRNSNLKSSIGGVTGKGLARGFI